MTLIQQIEATNATNLIRNYAI